MGKRRCRSSLFAVWGWNSAPHIGRQSSAVGRAGSIVHISYAEQAHETPLPTCVRRVTVDPLRRTRTTDVYQCLRQQPDICRHNTLQTLAGQEVSDSVDGHILTPWRQLTRSLTNHAAVRVNRTIEQGVSGRYGIPSPESAAILLRSVWFQEILLNG